MDLLSTLANWNRTGIAGGVLLSGPDSCTIAMHQRVRPIPTLRGLLDVHVGADTLARGEPFVTAEGEYAAMAETQTSDTRYAIAVVVGDESAATLVGCGPVGASVDLGVVVRQLAEHTFMGAGALRRRKYLYTPPPGWVGLEEPYAARWLHPEYPLVAHTCTIYDARPMVGTEPEIADRLLFRDTTHGRRKDPPEELVPVRTASDLAGVIARINYWDRGHHIAVVRCTLRDERFVYSVELSGPSHSLAADLGVFSIVVDSVQAVPEPAVVDRSNTVLYWGD